MTKEIPFEWSPDDVAPMTWSPTSSFSPVTILSSGATIPVTHPDKDGALFTGGSERIK